MDNKKKITLLIIILLSSYILIKLTLNKSDEMIKEDSYSAKELFSNFNEDKTKSSSDLQMLIYKTKQNEVLEIKEDYYLNYSLIIDKPIIIDFKGNKVYGKSLINFLTINTSNVTIKNGIFFLIDVPLFLQSSSILHKNINVLKNSFFLEKESTLSTNLSEIKFSNNFVSIEKNNSVEECSLFSHHGEKNILKNNFFIDKSNKCLYGIVLSNLEQSEIFNNIIVSHLKTFTGVINISNSKNINIKNNILVDTNEEDRIYLLKKETDSEDEEGIYHEGSISFKFYNVNGVNVVDNILLTKNNLIEDSSNNINMLDNKMIDINFKNSIVDSLYILDCEFYNFLKKHKDLEKNYNYLLNNCKK